MAKQDKDLDEFLLSLHEFLTGHLVERGLIEDDGDDADDEDVDLDDLAADDEDDEDSDEDEDADEDDSDEDEDDEDAEEEDEEITARREELLGLTVPALKKAVKAAELDPADMKGWSLADIVEAVLEVEFGADDEDSDEDEDDEDAEEEDEPKPAKKAAAKKAAPAKKTTTKGRLRATSK